MRLVTWQVLQTSGVVGKERVGLSAVWNENCLSYQWVDLRRTFAEGRGVSLTGSPRPLSSF